MHCMGGIDASHLFINPHDPLSWKYAAWEEGYNSPLGSINPYIGHSEELADCWQDGKESFLLRNSCLFHI